MTAGRRGFLQLFGAGVVFTLTPSWVLAKDALSALRRVGPGYVTPWSPLEARPNALFRGDDGARRIVDAAYRASGVSGDAAAMDYAIFDIGATQSPASKKPALLQSSILPDSLVRHMDDAAPRVPDIAVRESRAGGFLVRLLRRDEVSGAWSVGPAIAGDLDLRRAPSGLTDSIGPGSPVPSFVVADSVAGVAWSRHSPSGVWYPAGSRFLRPGQQGPRRGRAPSSSEIETLKSLPWSNETRAGLWRSEIMSALEAGGRRAPEIFDIPDDPLRPGAPGGATSLAAVRSETFARESFLWIDLATGARWVDKGPLFAIRSGATSGATVGSASKESGDAKNIIGAKLRMWRIGDDGSLAGVSEFRQ